MLKKNEVLTILDNGGHITLCDVYRTANVYDAAGDHIGVCRFDTAERIGSMDQYTTRSGEAWTYTRYIDNPDAAEAAREAAAEALEEITTPGLITLVAKASTYVGDRRIEKGRTYLVTVYGDGSHSVPGNAYGSLYDFRADHDAIKFEIIDRPAPVVEEPAQAEAEPVTVKNAATGEVIQGTARQVYAAVLLMLRMARHDGEPVPAWAPASDNATRVVHAAYMVYNRQRKAAAAATETTPAQEAEPIKNEEEQTMTTTTTETRQEQTDRENREHCEYIAREVEAYTDGNTYRCPECGEVIPWSNAQYSSEGNLYTCQACGDTFDADDLEEPSLYDFFADAYDMEYRVGSDKEYRSVRIMVAFGGPNIYIDTATRAVELYWWTDRASFPLSQYAVDAIDEWAAEYWEVL